MTGGKAAQFLLEDEKMEVVLIATNVARKRIAMGTRISAAMMYVFLFGAGAISGFSMATISNAAEEC